MDKESTEFPSFWKARYDFEGNPEGMQLSFRKGDTFLVTCRHEGGWFTAERNRRKGYVPSNYLEKIEKEEEVKALAGPPPKKEKSEALPPRMRSAAPAAPKTRSFSGGEGIQAAHAASSHNPANASTGNLPIVPQRRAAPNLTVRVPGPNTSSISPLITPPSTPPFHAPSPLAFKPGCMEDEGVPPPMPSAPPTQFKPPSAPPVIPLRPDQGELACDRKETGPAEVECDKELLQTATPFIKHAKKGKPSKKIIQLDGAGIKLLWKDYEKKRLEGFIILDDIIATKRGHVGKKALKGVDPNFVLSIICSDESKSLELEAESQEMRDRWLGNFDKLLLMHSKERLR